MCLSPRPKDPARPGQAPVCHGRHTVLAVLASLSAVAGCGPVERFYDSKLTPDTPIEWWQDLQGGRIAAVRPPPPGVADPYPNLAAVPARPVLPDAATRRALQARLIAERDRTKQEGERDPIGTAPAPPPTPAVPASATNPTAPTAPTAAKPMPDPDASTMVFDAATAAPAGPAAPVTAAPVLPQAPAGVVAPRQESGPLPDLPGAVPAAPRLGGIPAGLSGPARPRPPPSVEVRFTRGSASLPNAAGPALRSLVERRAGGAILVIAGGDAAPGAMDRQASALQVALRRARAIAQSLMEAGVPAASLQYEVSASGRGGGARLLAL